MKAFNARGKEAQKLKDDSELCPRLDKIIASELVDRNTSPVLTRLALSSRRTWNNVLWELVHQEDDT
jgi:hypothetical protein